MKTFKLRTNYLISPKVQLTMIIIPIVMYSVCFIVSLVFLSFYFKDALSSFEAAGITPTHPIYQYMGLQKSKIFSVMGLSLLVGFILNTIVLTWVTHKIVGPIYRMRKAMESLLAGEELSPIKLRRGDFFTENAELLEEIRKRGLK